MKTHTMSTINHASKIYVRAGLALASTLKHGIHNQLDI